MIKIWIIKWALKQIIKLSEKDISFTRLDKYGIEDIYPNAADDEAINIVVRKDLSTLD